MNLYPWHFQLWQQLCDYHARDRLAHALLFSGPPAIGKLAFAEQLAEFLLCATPVNHAPCGQCHSCHLLAAGNHPDLIVIRPQENSKTIKVDEIRTFVAAVTMTPQIAARRAVIIEPAQAMNRSAANSLLKTLEEPNPENYIVLVSDAPWELPATIRSRCQQVVMPLPAEQASLAWLNQQEARNDWTVYLRAMQGAPLDALALQQSQGLAHYQAEKRRFASLLQGQESALSASAIWAQDSSGYLHDWLFRWLLDLARAVQGGQQTIQDPDLSSWLGDLIPRINSVKLHALLDAFLAMQRGMRQRNLNSQMHYDAFAVQLQEITG
jgi:DNA polymerase-3 subunit delta'